MKNTTFILFGATGDLAKRKIFPALYNLFHDNLLPEKFSIIGLGRKEMSHVDFQAHVEKSLNEFSRREVLHTDSFKQFLASFHYSALNIDKTEDYDKLLELSLSLEENDSTRDRLFYFSVAPEFFKTIAQNIEKSGLAKPTGDKKLLIEKPFGHDLASAHELNEELSKAFSENEVFRIDHYLGKNMVQKLRTLKSKNPLLSKLWNKEYIANIQISALESVGVEERAGYYDHTGALRDMFQNHLLQVLSLIAISNDEDSNIREEKKIVLENLKQVSSSDFHKNFVFGQYERGLTSPSYQEEPGVAKNSQTETFLAAKMFIENEMWSGIPFYVRTGKKASEKMTKIVIEFKKDKNETKANYLEIEINPKEKVTLYLNGEKNEPILLSQNLSETNPQEAYEKLIFDALKGDANYFAHWDEVRLSWEFVQPLLDKKAEENFSVEAYPSGTDGPIKSTELLLNDGFVWL